MIYYQDGEVMRYPPIRPKGTSDKDWKIYLQNQRIVGIENVAELIEMYTDEHGITDWLALESDPRWSVLLETDPSVINLRDYSADLT